jgi:hypothetical protein
MTSKFKIDLAMFVMHVIHSYNTITGIICVDSQLAIDFHGELIIDAYSHADTELSGHTDKIINLSSSYLPVSIRRMAYNKITLSRFIINCSSIILFAEYNFYSIIVIRTYNVVT